MPMTSPESSPANTGAARRPSLFEQPAGHARTPHREIAVLAPFATQKPAQPSIRWATAGVAAVASAFALLAGATLWAVVNGGNTEAPPPPIAQRPATKAAPAAVSLVAAAQSEVADASPVQTAVVSEAATGATLVDTPPVSESTAATSPASAERAINENPAIAPHIEAAHAPARHQASSATPKSPAHKSAETNPRTRSTKPKGEADTALLAALVSHIDHTAEQTANRDVVGASSQQGSTAELVARCDRLGGLEGSLCRKRICKGLWGTDPACPSR